MQKVNPGKTRELLKRWPRLYETIVWIFGPAYLGGLSPRAFIRKYSLEGTRINLGSGPKTIDKTFKNIDLFQYSSVDLVADVTKVPLESGSVSMIVCDNVLEHVLDPDRASLEMHRLLKNGGFAYISTPFLYPFHSSPSDYRRWTTEGLRALFRDFEVIEVGVRSGGFSTLNAFLVSFFASLLCFGSSRIYHLLSDVLIFVFFPIKYLDVLANHLPYAEHTASVLYCVVRKK